MKCFGYACNCALDLLNMSFISNTIISFYLAWQGYGCACDYAFLNMSFATPTCYVTWLDGVVGYAYDCALELLNLSFAHQHLLLLLGQVAFSGVFFNSFFRAVKSMTWNV